MKLFYIFTQLGNNPLQDYWSYWHIFRNSIVWFIFGLRVYWFVRHERNVLLYWVFEICLLGIDIICLKWRWFFNICLSIWTFQIFFSYSFFCFMDFWVHLFYFFIFIFFFRFFLLSCLLDKWILLLNSTLRYIKERILFFRFLWGSLFYCWCFFFLFFLFFL